MSICEVVEPVALLIRTALHRVGATLWTRPYWSQAYWSYGAYGPTARGYYGTPYGPGPQSGDSGGDQYGNGPGYRYARQAPSRPRR